MNLLYPFYKELMEFEEYISKTTKSEQHNFIDNYRPIVNWYICLH